jgi:uncharacterized protein (TIGR04255 family)
MIKSKDEELLHMSAVYDSVCYARTFLSEVAVQIDFLEPPDPLNGMVLPANIQAELKKNFPIYEPGSASSHELLFSEEGVAASREEFRQWVYHGKEREKTISLNKKQACIRASEYSTYETLKEDVLSPINAISTQDPEKYVSRTGLRYVNIYPDLLSGMNDVSTYFSAMLSGPLASLDNAENCSRSFLITEYIYEDAKVRMQTGVYNPDYPARIKRRDFILDIDAYSDTPHQFAEVGKILDQLHQFIQVHFESSITEALREKMNAAE